MNQGTAAFCRFSKRHLKYEMKQKNGGGNLYYISSAIINKEVQSYSEYTKADGKSHVCPREEFTKRKRLKTRRMGKDKHHLNTFSYNGFMH